MKKQRKIFILLGMLAILAAATFLVARVEEKKEQIRAAGDAILEISPDTVRKLSWDNGEEKLSFRRSDDGSWVYEEDEAFPVSEDRIDELLSVFEDFRAAFTIDEVEDFGQYGLNDPICTIDLSTDDGEVEMLLGDYSSMDEQRYVSIGDGRAYLAVSDPFDEFEAGLTDMIAHDEIPYMSSTIGMVFSGNENYAVRYEEESADTYCADDIYFVTVGSDIIPLDTDKVKAYLRTVSNLELSEYVSYNASEEELSEYGLAEPELTVSANYTREDDDGNEIDGSILVSISRDPEELSAIAEKEAEAKAEAEESEDEEEAAETSGGEEEEEEEITAYLRVGKSGIIYKITADEYEALMKAGVNDLRHDEVFSGSFEDVERIDITIDGTTYRITTEPEIDASEQTDDEEAAGTETEGTDADAERIFYYNGEEIDLSEFEDALSSVSAESFTSEKPADKEEISLKIYLANENFPEVDISLFRYDGSSCIALIDGEAVSFVPRASVVSLVEAVNSIVLRKAPAA